MARALRPWAIKGRKKLGPLLAVRIDCEQSLFFHLSSPSRGKTSRTPTRGNLGKEKLDALKPRREKKLEKQVFPCLGFRASAFLMSFHGSTNSRGKIRTARSLYGPRTRLIEVCISAITTLTFKQLLHRTRTVIAPFLTTNHKTEKPETTRRS